MHRTTPHNKELRAKVSTGLKWRNLVTSKPVFSHVKAVSHGARVLRGLQWPAGPLGEIVAPALTVPVETRGLD